MERKKLDQTKLKETLTILYKTNNLLRKPYTGLYVASLGEEYVNYVWIRDTYYQAKPSLNSNPEAYVQTYRSLLDYYKGLNYKYDDKLDELIRKPYPLNNIRFIHPRFYPDLTEITGDWGNLQLDTFGYFFLGVAEGLEKELPVIRDESDRDIIRKLIKILSKIEYWNIEDNGIWEEPEEIHASSIGAILSGLLALEKLDFSIPRKLIEKGIEKLNHLLPRESITKQEDLALLTLIYPFNIVSEEIKEYILERVHKELERDKGVARYVGDKYYRTEQGEAEWTFGYSYLFFSYIDKDLEKAEQYLEKILECIDDNGFIPELYYAKTDKPNPNSPLGWSVAMAILSIEKYLEKVA